ncbi:hypothetical protein AXE80_03920 [Wenyingzhuangia fucanilytica]|uniref:Sensor of ECF-type sigma factor n=1 Tax=Wenyingzhuangia fucanilytica TaxID=1790137 RepID=A0A1B1Y3Y2_9FLAO|nr:hypothetical protein [Wenyingzhuangia fucanilytica]ANW95476.1 hypothetical protein AXE80_03920 [Wenyingzhuangia fucanilytica]
MKKHITLIALFLLTSSIVFGQGNDKNSREKIATAKISFISNELSLTPEQAEKFWPVYNSLKDEIYSLYQQKRELERNVNHDKITEKQAKIVLEKIIAKNQEIDRKKADFMKDLGKILNNKQLLKLNYAEHKFKKTLLERIKKEH